MFEIIKGVCELMKSVLKPSEKAPPSELSKRKFYVRAITVDGEMLPERKLVFSMAEYNKNGDVIIRGKSSVEKK